MERHLLCTAAVCATLLLSSPVAYGGASTELFPAVTGWTMVQDSTVYTPANLWDLIDGAAELFLSYGFVDLNIAEYHDQTGIDVRVELYRHSTRVNAFGMYTQERNPEYHFVDIGTQGYIEDGVLNFLAGTFYAKVSTHTPGKNGRDGMMMIGQKVLGQLKQETAWPAALSLFSPEGMQKNTESYIAENFLGYHVLHSAYLAVYTRGTRFQVFIIENETLPSTQQMLDSYLRAINQPRDDLKEGIYTVSDPHNGAIEILWRGKYMCGIVNCSDKETRRRELNELDTRILELAR
jgi:hypothetical protein